MTLRRLLWKIRYTIKLGLSGCLIEDLCLSEGRICWNEDEYIIGQVQRTCTSFSLEEQWPSATYLQNVPSCLTGGTK